MKKLLTILMALFVVISCSSKDGNEKSQQKKIEPKVLLTSAQLEKYGFENFEARFFRLYLLDEGFILASIGENNIIRYKSPDDVRQYKASGQGPAEFQRPYYIFRYDDQTLGIYDNLKHCVLLFDMDLNYKAEIKVHPMTRRISSTKDGKCFISFGYFGEYVFALLDQQFNRQETFIKTITKSRLPRMYPMMLNNGYFLNETKFVFTQRYYTEKECKADIYEIASRKKLLTLKWEQDRARTKKDRLNLVDNYNSKYVFEYDGFYLVSNLFVKKVGAPVKYDLIIFDKKGKIRYRDKNFPYYPIEINNTPKSRLYFIDDNEDLVFCELNELVSE